MNKILILAFLLFIADCKQDKIYPRFVIDGDQFIYHNHRDAEIIYIKL